MSTLDTCSVETPEELLGNMPQTSFCREPGNINGSFERPTTAASDSGLIPIAVVGMGMRLPGDVRSSTEFWETLINKKDGHGKVPPTRYNADSFYHRFAEGFVKTKHGYFLQEDPAYFDAGFFGMTGYEASRLDPQQRLLLEVVWECLENAGEVNWAGKDIGCYVGVFGEDWLGMAYRDPLHTDRSHAIGTGGLALANMISYHYDLRGPSMTIETGCSSSLVGLHEACQGLMTGTCSSAIVGGSNLILAPTMTASMCSNMVLSPSGVCRTFDAKADGYGRGEAINILYLKRLDDALRHNDPIRAVIRSTATNSDGKTQNISVPSMGAQASLIQAAYQRAGIRVLSDTGFIECHGTGTQAGDAIECKAISKVFAGTDMVIGSVKPNFGHSEGASGLTSVIKAVLSMEHETIPPNIHFDTKNESLARAKLIVPCQPMPWPVNRRKRVSVNGFGIGGSNVHVILDSPSELSSTGAPSEPQISTGPALLVVSARDARSLEARIRQVNDYVNAHPQQLADLAYTLAVRREHMSHRAYAICNKETLLDPSHFVKAQSEGCPTVSFVFTGQGAQWMGMGKGLMETDAGFREDMIALRQTLKGLPDPPEWELDDELTRTDVRRDGDAEFSQPLTTAVQIGLVKILARSGVHPEAVLGHSSGEIAAAYAAGAISADSAIAIAYYRGKVAKSQSGMGEMASVGLSSKDVAPFLVDGVVVACHNSPRSVTLSGDRDRIDHVVEQIKAQLPDVFCRRLRVNVAYHSQHMKALGPSYAAMINSYIESNNSMLPMHSTVNGRAVEIPSDLNADYWRANLENPVRFSDAVNALLDSRSAQTGHVIIEIGPHSTLFSPINQILQTRQMSPQPVYVHTLVRHDPDVRRQILSVMGKVHINGATPDLRGLTPRGCHLIDLPPYPWNHTKKHWNESRVVRDWRFIEHPYHELLGLRCPESTDIEPSWRNLLDLNTVPWVAGHVVQGQIVLPGSGYIAMAGEAVRQLSTDAVGYSVKEVQFKNTLVLEDAHTVETVTTLRPVTINDLTDSSWFLFTVMSHDGSNWVKNCAGKVCPRGEADSSSVSINSYARQVPSRKWYDLMPGLGLSYGLQFAGLKNITVDPCASRASAQVSDTMDGDYTSRYFVHPTMIDQCLQLMGIAKAKGLPRHLTAGGIPISIGRMDVNESRRHMNTHVDVQQTASHGFTGNATATVDGRTVLSIRKAQYFSLGLDHSSVERRIPLTARMRWLPDIKFQNVETLFSQLPMTDADRNSYSLLDRIISLYILQTEQLIRDVRPHAEHMAKWKDWIALSSSHILQDYRSFLESFQWHQLSELDRWGLIEDLRSEMIGQNHNTIIPANYMLQIYQTCLDSMAGSLPEMGVPTKNNQPVEYHQSDVGYGDWSRYLQFLSHSNPKLRILEIGGSSGTATAESLKWLYVSGAPSYGCYCFTDISLDAMAAAKERFREYEGLEYKILDISRDPLLQGYSAQSFDLVIASNVLHATPCVKRSLQHIYKLLTPQGHLLLHEFNPASKYVNYIMGTSPSWYTGREYGRTDRSFTTPERWNIELQACGFTGADVFCYDLEPPYHTNATVLTRVASGPDQPTHLRTITLIAYDRSHTWVKSIATELGDMGYEVRWGTLNESPAPGDCVLLLMDVQEPFLYDITEEDYYLLHRYLGQSDNCTLLWITRMTQLRCEDPRYSLVPGFVRVLRAETMIDLRMVEIETFDEAAITPLMEILADISRGASEKGSEDLEYEFAIRNGEVLISRCIWERRTEETLPTPKKSTKKLVIGTPGLFDTLHWVDSGNRDLGPNDVEVKMCYVGLNFKDIMAAMGFVGQKDELGIEGTGVVLRVGSDIEDIGTGDKVLLLGAGILTTQAIKARQECILLPKTASVKDVATMATVFVTVIYCFVYLAQIRKDQSVLIHSACGGVGLAAIQTCQVLGVDKIFVTVGNDKKRDHLISNFGLPADHIFESRNNSFLPSLMNVTGGRGVDIVLNSLSGDLLHASWECVAPCGKMIELGKRDFLANGELHMGPFLKNRAFYGVDLMDLERYDLELLRKVIRHFMTWYIEGKIHPIRPVTTFQAADILDAFRHMQSGEHIGKLLIQMPDDALLLPSTDAKEAIAFSSEASYLLIGGLGGLGRAISIWMVENGARSLVFLSRRLELTGSNKEHVVELEAMGCSVNIVQGDVAQLQDVQRAVSQCPHPLKGVLHMALSLHDCTFSQMSFEKWVASLSPKVQGAWNLHHSVSTQALDFFVLFSSTAGICGNMGQANYAAANTFLDAFAQYRRQCGLPASVLALGAVADVGVVSRDPKLVQYFEANGVYMLSEAEVLGALHRCIQQSCQFNPDEGQPQWSAPLVTGLGHTKPVLELGGSQLWHQDARFRSYSNLESLSVQAESAMNSKLRELINQIERDPSILLLSETEVVLAGEFAACITQHQPGSQVSDNELSLTIDSLMAIEVRNWFRRNLGLEMAMAEISKARTVGSLISLTIERLKAKYNVAESQDV